MASGGGSGGDAAGGQEQEYPADGVRSEANRSEDSDEIPGPRLRDVGAAVRRGITSPVPAGAGPGPTAVVRSPPQATDPGSSTRSERTTAAAENTRSGVGVVLRAALLSRVGPGELPGPVTSRFSITTRAAFRSGPTANVTPPGPPAFSPTGWYKHVPVVVPQFAQRRLPGPRRRINSPRPRRPRRGRSRRRVGPGVGGRRQCRSRVPGWLRG